MARKRTKKVKSKKKSVKELPLPTGAVEYLVVPINVTESPESLTNQLNLYGNQGWQLVVTSGNPAMGRAEAWFIRAV